MLNLNQAEIFEKLERPLVEMKPCESQSGHENRREVVLLKTVELNSSPELTEQLLDLGRTLMLFTIVILGPM